MENVKRKFKKVKLVFTLLLLLIFYGNAKSQTFTYFGFADANGDGLGDWHYVTSNYYVGILHGIPGGGWPVGNQVNWSWYYCGPGFGLLGWGDADGLPGGETIAYQPTGTSVIVITDRIRNAYGYSLGGNRWVQCPNWWANFDGAPGNEMLFNFYERSPISKRGYMIIHRTRSTRSTWSCSNLAVKDKSSGSPSTLEADINTIDEDVVEPPTNEYTGPVDVFAGNVPNLSPPERNYPDINNFEVMGNPSAITRNITLTPNPSKGLVNLRTDQPDEVIQQITVTDVTGKTVFVSRLNKRTADISHLNNGLYFIRIRTDKKSYMGKVLKE